MGQPDHGGRLGHVRGRGLAARRWGAADAPFGFLHRVLIGQFGMALGELWSLDDLAADCVEDGVHEFFLTSAPLNVPGGIGSPPNALAIK